MRSNPYKTDTVKMDSPIVNFPSQSLEESPLSARDIQAVDPRPTKTRNQYFSSVGMVRSEATSITHTKTRQRKEKLRIRAMKRPLDRQEIAYRKASVVIDESYDNLNESGDIFNFFRENKVKIIKFNNTFDKSVQNQASYDGFMQI